MALVSAKQASATGTLTLPFPTTAYTVTQTYHGGTSGGGYDLVPTGTPVIIAADGGNATVNWDANCSPSNELPTCSDGICNPGESFGRWVDIDHGGGFHTVYVHLASFSIGNGAVSRGQQIGVMGRAGCATGYHLHFGTRQNSSYFDPGNPKSCDISTARWTTCPATVPPPASTDGDGDGLTDIRDRGDFDGDGKSDLIHSANQGDTYWWRGTASGPQMAADFVDPTYHNEWGTWYVGDFDGDGKSDLMHSADQGAAYWWRGSATGPQMAGNIVDPNYHNEWGTWHVGDFDGDGKSDLIHSANQGDAYWWRGSASGPVWAGDIVDPGYHNEWGTWYVGDFDGDGKSDLIHSANQGDTYWWRGTASGPQMTADFVVPTYRNEWGTWHGGYAGAECYSPNNNFDGDGLGPVCDPDSDDDGATDPFDNCVAWPNPNQTPPAWSIAFDDVDCDGLSSASETAVGTDPTQHCNATPAPNDEPDAWPPDFNDSQTTNLQDVILFGPTFNKSNGQAGYNQRFDLNTNSSVNLSDVVMMGPFFNKNCA
jgi:hypothetical protein